MFGPKNEEEKLIFASEAIGVDACHILNTVMRLKDISREDLARKVDIPVSVLNEAFKNNMEGMPLKTLAQLFEACGDKLSINSTEYYTYLREEKDMLPPEEIELHEAVKTLDGLLKEYRHWEEYWRTAFFKEFKSNLKASAYVDISTVVSILLFTSTFVLLIGAFLGKY